MATNNGPGRTWFRTALYGVRSIQNDGVTLPERNTLNFQGATVVDNPLTGAIDVVLDTSATAFPTPGTVMVRDDVGATGVRGLTVSDPGGDNIALLPTTLTMTEGASPKILLDAANSALYVYNGLISTETVSAGTVSAGTYIGRAYEVVQNTPQPKGVTVPAMPVSGYNNTGGVSDPPDFYHRMGPLDLFFTGGEYISTHAAWAGSADRGPTLTWGVDVPDGVTITTVEVALKGPTHAASLDPDNPVNTKKPRIVLWKVQPNTNTYAKVAGVDPTSGVDATTTNAAYIATHTVSLTGLTEVVDRNNVLLGATNTYYVTLLGERPAVNAASDALPGVIVYGCRVTYTIPTSGIDLVKLI